QRLRREVGNTAGEELMQFRVSPKTLSECSAEQWQARVDLAAAHRLAFIQGFSEGIFNHLTFVVPGSTDRYYQIPFGTHWSEVTASCFMEVGIDDQTVLFMANHGISTVGATVAEAYDMLYYVERAAQVQIYAMWTGQRLKQLPAPVVEKTRRDYKDEHLYKGPTPAQGHFDAL